MPSVTPRFREAALTILLVAGCRTGASDDPREPGAPPSAPPQAYPWDGGTWLCLVCGETEEQLRHEGKIVDRSAAKTLTSDEDDALAFHAWYWRAIDDEHEHDWLGIGCHGRGSSRDARNVIGCAIRFPFRRYFSRLPALPDQRMALRIVNALASATAERRRAMLRDFEERFDEPPIGRGEAMSDRELRRFLSAWNEAETGGS